MRLSSMATLAAIRCSTFATAKPTLINESSPAILEWTGKIIPGKGNQTISGVSFEDIEIKAKVINPEFSILFNTSQSAHGNDLNILEALTKVDCTRGRNVAVQTIDEGIAYLRNIKGDCNLDAGPHCSRVSCSWNVGIFYCNNGRKAMTKPCASIGDMAQQVVNYCVKYGFPDRNFKPDWKAGGEAYDSSGWSTLVDYSPC